MEKRFLIAASLLALCLVLTAAVAWGQSSASFDLSWHVISGGGGPLPSTVLTLNGTLGQWAASPPYSSGDHCVVSAGYWFAGGLTIPRLYLPLVLKSFPQ